MVTFSESFTAFLRTERDKGSDVARLIMAALNLQSEFPTYGRVLTTKEVNYITMRPDGLLSYLPAGKEHKVNERGEWARDGRQSGKAGKIIRKVFTEKMQRLIKASAFESFGNAYKAKFMDNGFTFSVRPNSEIPDVYCMSLAEGESSLSSSCMNGDRSYLYIYSNCKRVSVLTLVNKRDQLCGRALVWKVNYKGNDITFMDRIYVVEDYMYDLFLNYAKEQGWWRKANYNSYSQKNNWVNPDTDETEYITVTIETDTDFSYYPYIDTFTYGGDGTLTNYDDDCLYTYTNINGTRDENESENEYEEENHDNETYDELTHEYISNDDAVCLSDRGERRNRGIWTHSDNAVEAITYGTGRRADREWFKEGDDNIVEINGEWYYSGHDEITCLHNGDYAMLEDTVMCETDNDYYLNDDDDLIQSEDGLYYHKENDDDVIYVQPTDKQRGKYVYLPDLEEGSVIQDHYSKYWYWADDSPLVKAELHLGYKCSTIYMKREFAVPVRKGKRVKFYHYRDIRLTKPSTRIAHAA